MGIKVNTVNIFYVTQHENVPHYRFTHDNSIIVRAQRQAAEVATSKFFSEVQKTDFLMGLTAQSYDCYSGARLLLSKVSATVTMIYYILRKLTGKKTSYTTECILIIAT